MTMAGTSDDALPRIIEILIPAPVSALEIGVPGLQGPIGETGTAGPAGPAGPSGPPPDTSTLTLDGGNF